MSTMMMIGNAHIDPVWLWRWKEGYHEVKATFRSALDRMNENPEFVFSCACADYYRWVEESDQEMFREIQQRVAQGQWVIAGGLWIQPDMNTPSGESFVRHLLYSQRYFYEKFGRIAVTGYNVDSFGHNAMMPQLFRLSGIENYVWMRPGMHENPDIPEGPMIWEGADGSRVLAYRIENEYNCVHDVPGKIDRLFEFAGRIGFPVMCFYGVGNHGGGPTIENLRQIDAYRARAPRGSEVSYASVDDYFEQIQSVREALPVWRGELQHHASGCYSTHSASKRLHRRAENALLSMETLGSLSRVLTGHQLRTPFVRQAWDNLMFNEFHDIMGGCSLREALEDCELQLSESISIAEREENAALQKISWQVDTFKGLPRVRSKEEDWKLWGVAGQGTPVVVFNPHEFDARGTVLIRRPIRAVRDDEGRPVPAQVIRASRTNGETDRWDGIFRAEVPALGYRLYWIFLEQAEAAENPLKSAGNLLENEWIRAEFDAQTGALCHLIDKRTGFDPLTAPASVRLMDIEHSDTWAHNLFRFDKEAGNFGNAEVRLLESGPVRAVLRVRSQFGHSCLEQKYILYADSDQLEMEVRLNLNERFRMVKLCYPTAGGRDAAEIPYGALERTGNGNEEHCQRWAAAQGEAGGLAVLNDGKYSYSMDRGELRLTIANSSIFADHYGQDYRDDTCEFMDQGEQVFKCALVPFAGSWRQAGLNRRAALLNRPLPSVTETYHQGPLGGCFRGIRLENPAIALGAFKRSEQDAGWILRLNETVGCAQHTLVELPVLNRSFELDFAPFQIRTLYLPDESALPLREVQLTEMEERKE